MEGENNVFVKTYTPAGREWLHSDYGYVILQ